MTETEICEDVIKRVSVRCNVSIPDLVGRKRDYKTALARHKAMYEIWIKTGLTLGEIGSHLGNRTPASVLHGILRISLAS